MKHWLYFIYGSFFCRYNYSCIIHDESSVNKLAVAIFQQIIFYFIEH